MRSDYYPTPEHTPLPAPPEPPRPRRQARPGVRLLCTLLVLAAVSVGGHFLWSALPGGTLPPLETGEPAQPLPTTPSESPAVDRAPLGDGTTLLFSPQPTGEPWSLQEIYQANLPSIVSVRGFREEGWSLGTGVIMSQDGYIITNSHVIELCSRLSVVLWDDRSYSAALVGRDGQTDLAVLKIDCDGLTPAQFGDSTGIQVGDMAVAIGNPLGDKLRGTMTDGIISAINRDVDVEGRTMTLIQTNAALNSGNSGGALINAFGQVVGITNMKMQSYTTPVEGLGFAIPTATVKTVVDALIAEGVVGGRPTIGITVQTVTPQQRSDLECPQGAYVVSVDRRSDAWARGLRPGDVIVEANGSAVAATGDLLAAKEGLGVGDILALRVWRAGDERTLNVALVEQYTLED